LCVGVQPVSAPLQCLAGINGYQALKKQLHGELGKLFNQRCAEVADQVTLTVHYCIEIDAQEKHHNTQQMAQQIGLARTFASRNVKTLNVQLIDHKGDKEHKVDLLQFIMEIGDDIAKKTDFYLHTVTQGRDVIHDVRDYVTVAELPGRDKHDKGCARYQSFVRLLFAAKKCTNDPVQQEEEGEPGSVPRRTGNPVGGASANTRASAKRKYDKYDKNGVPYRTVTEYLRAQHQRFGGTYVEVDTTDTSESSSEKPRKVSKASGVTDVAEAMHVPSRGFNTSLATESTVKTEEVVRLRESQGADKPDGMKEDGVGAKEGCGRQTLLIGEQAEDRKSITESATTNRLFMSPFQILLEHSPPQARQEPQEAHKRPAAAAAALVQQPVAFTDEEKEDDDARKEREIDEALRKEEAFLQREAQELARAQLQLEQEQKLVAQSMKEMKGATDRAEKWERLISKIQEELKTAEEAEAKRKAEEEAEKKRKAENEARRKAKAEQLRLKQEERKRIHAQIQKLEGDRDAVTKRQLEIETATAVQVNRESQFQERFETAQQRLNLLKQQR